MPKFVTVTLLSIGGCVLACEPSSSPPEPAPGSDASVATSPGTPPASPPKSPPSSGACPSGNERPAAAIVKAVEQLVGSWVGTDIGNIDNTKSGLIFGPPSANVVDWGCVYVDNGGWISMVGHHAPDSSTPTCTTELARLSIPTGIPDADGAIIGYRVILKPDGAPSGQPKLESGWIPGASLIFDGEHFAAGVPCKP